MTGRVDFYVLGGAAQKQRWTFACRLTEKAYLRGMRVVIVGETAEELQALDDLLWTFNERSFVPHKICVDFPDADLATPVLLMRELPAGAVPVADLLVNLGNRLPVEPGRFARIAEIIDADPERRRLGRERFKAYRELRLALETHQLHEAAAL
jgi:DNA polymerase-3 subunit chi